MTQTMNRTMCQRLRRVLESDDFAEFLTAQMGFDCRAAVTQNMRYTDHSVDAKISITNRVDDSGEVVNPHRDAWNRHARMYGLTAEDYGKVVTFPNGTRYELIGIKPRNRKYPILATRVRDGASFKLPSQMVRAALGR